MNEKIEKYINKMFTEHGHKSLFNYLKNLIRLSYEIKKYPYFRKGRLLGFPDNAWFRHYNSKDELMGQIKMLMNVLGFEKVHVVLSNGDNVLFSFKRGGSKNDA